VSDRKIRGSDGFVIPERQYDQWFRLGARMMRQRVRLRGEVGNRHFTIHGESRLASMRTGKSS
jgi:hypothetical protein